MTNPEAQQSLESYVETRLAWMGDAVELVTGDRNIDPATVFELPMQDAEKARADDEGLQLSGEQQAGLREIAGRFGIGGEADVRSTAKQKIAEGAKPWKIEGEAAIGANIFAGSSFRKIGADEISYMERKYGGQWTGKTEYDVARTVAEAQESFVALAHDEEMPFGYEITPEHAFVAEPTGKLVGQLVHIGDKDGEAVLLLRVDGEAYVDDKGKAQQRNRPDSAELMGFVAQVLTECGDETSSIGLVTSSTYASRAIDAVRVGLKFNRMFDVGMYGRQTLADVKGEAVARPSDINQIPGELGVVYYKLMQLQQELATQE
jgi:hypothetical protein